MIVKLGDREEIGVGLILAAVFLCWIALVAMIITVIFGTPSKEPWMGANLILIASLMITGLLLTAPWGKFRKRRDDRQSTV